ncbi:MAG: hypothetical protein J3K34DRAFT_527103 [Monoraphidium minutum]|nr:MAG: hypothetical protein J3K34DRAFT_527103 [Monoraphidium minutum]
MLGGLIQRRAWGQQQRRRRRGPAAPAPARVVLPLAMHALAALALLAPLARARTPWAQVVMADAHEPEMQEWLVQQRRQLHMIPELAFEEVKTSAHIRAALDELGIPYTYPVAKTGIVARVGPPPYRVALRADMDGLPIAEGPRGLAYESTHPGRMHACGHDAHSAMLLGAARLLQRRAAELAEAGRGGVALLWQPAEEGLGGAGVVLDEGALAGVEAIFGMHVWPLANSSGTLGTRPGPVMAASTRFSVTIRGRGGHAALPHAAIDPVVAAAQAVIALQPLVSRETSPVDSAVISVTRFNTGPGAVNVIPESVELQGTLRALSAPTFERLQRRIQDVVNATAAAAGCAAAGWAWSAVPYPPLVNDPGLAALAARVAQSIEAAAAAAALPSGGGGGASGGGGGGPPLPRFTPLEAPTLAAEDFAIYGARGGIPSCFLFMGVEGGRDGEGRVAGLHTPWFQAEEARLPLGAALHAALALEALEWLGAGGAGGAAAAGGGAEPDRSEL